MFILDNSGEGYLPVGRIKQVLNMHGIKISLGQVMDLTDEASINEKGESNYLEIMSLLMGEEAIGTYVYRIAKQAPDAFSPSVKDKYVDGVRKSAELSESSADSSFSSMSMQAAYITIPEIQTMMGNIKAQLKVKRHKKTQKTISFEEFSANEESFE